MSADPGATDGAITYEQWGVDFFLEAISEQRVLGAVDTIAGQAIDFGPISAGPGGIDQAWASLAPRPDADEGVLADLDDALEQEIRDNEQALLGGPESG